MSMAYHPETDGSSECTNKTVSQSLHFHVDCQQKGWVHTLPQIHFAIMNTINALTGYSKFQLHLGHSPCIIPSIIPLTLGSQVEDLISQMSKRPKKT